MTETELRKGVACGQDVLWVMLVLQSLVLEVKLSLLLEMNNKGGVNLANNCNFGGQTRNINVQQYFLHELKV